MRVSTLVGMWQSGRLVGAQLREDCKSGRFVLQGSIHRIEERDGSVHIDLDWQAFRHYSSRSWHLLKHGRPVTSAISWARDAYSMNKLEDEDVIEINPRGASFSEDWEILLPNHCERIAKPAISRREKPKAKRRKKRVA